MLPRLIRRKVMCKEIKMNDPILAKSFNSYDRKKLGWCALILCLTMALIRSTFKPNLHPLSAIGEFVNLQLSNNVVYDMLASTNQTTDQPTVGNESTDLHPSINNTTLISKPSGVNKTVEPLCRILNNYTDYCDMEGDVRIQVSSSTIFVVTDQHENTPNSTNSWIMQPYARRLLPNVKNWTVKAIARNEENGELVPQCTQNHSFPAILFSTGGYSGNHFHDLADILYPLYSTSHRFSKDVEFLVTDYSPEWMSKFGGVARLLTRSDLVNIDEEPNQVHCYKKLIAGLNYYMEFFIDPSDSGYPAAPSMKKFRPIVRQAFGLKRASVVITKEPPRLMIMPRRRTRVLTNEDEVSQAAKEVGFEVVVPHEALPTNLTSFVQEVNSCDVLLGVHGAGLTNMLFLPDRALVIQIVPLGDIDPYAALDYNWPTKRMNLSYLEYKITRNESSLIRQYSLDHRVFRDPLYYHRKGWNGFAEIYLNNQNVTVDVERFRGTLVDALKVLGR